ncbi:bactofilin family protein [Aliigemmobacter aestuarii]|nr:polymer-forming cytoskeletal protein [Gemmobacter aestuarii]
MSTLSPPGAGRSLIAPDLTITGDVKGGGSIEVQGAIDGKVDVQGLTIGHEGRLKGSARAETVELRGRIDGKISCRDLTIRSAAQLKADVNYVTLHIDSGAQVEGRFTRPKTA